MWILKCPLDYDGVFVKKIMYLFFEICFEKEFGWLHCQRKKDEEGGGRERLEKVVSLLTLMSVRPLFWWSVGRLVWLSFPKRAECYSYDHITVEYSRIKIFGKNVKKNNWCGCLRFATARYFHIFQKLYFDILKDPKFHDPDAEW